MEDTNVCPVCFEIFTMAKLLPCKHSFCLKCLEDYSDQTLHQKQAACKVPETQPTEEYLQKSSNKIVCPLCREVFQIPKKGFQDFLTNYFVNVSKPISQCQICEKRSLSNFCTTCFKFLCNCCFKAHEHSNKTSRIDDEAEPRDPNLPLHLLFMGVLRTEYICNLVRSFNLNLPPNGQGMRWIYTVFAARNGGAYVLPQTVPFILKFDSHGTLLGKIRTPSPCSCIIELKNEDILGIFRKNLVILRYTCGGWTYFVTTDDFFPMALAELSDSRIIVVGHDKLNNETNVDIHGIVRIYNYNGDAVGNIVRKDPELSFILPQLAACNKHKKTFAICDRKRCSVTIFHENGDEIMSYNGGFQMLGLFIPLFGLQSPENFEPIELCCSPSGNFVVSTTDGTLHILDPYGKLRGIAVTNCEDGFGRLTDVAVDIHGNIWCSNSEHGTIRIFRLIKYKNHFSSR